MLKVVHAAFNDMGIPTSSDFNDGSNYGVGLYELNQRNGRRLSAACAFLGPAIRRPNLEVVCGLTAQKIEFLPDGRPGAVVCTVAGKSHRSTVRAELEPDGEMLLCAGAVHTPCLLQVSGVGPRAVIDALGVPLVRDVPAVGENLQDHLQIRPVFRVFGAPSGEHNAYAGCGVTLNTVSRSWVGCARIGLDYALRRSGPLSMAPSQLAAFLPSSSAEPHPNLQFHVQPLSLTRSAARCTTSTPSRSAWE